MDRIITIQGSVSKSVLPDTATINMTLSGICDTREKAQKESDKQFKLLSEAFSKMDLQLKSRHFSVYKEYIYSDNGKGESVRQLLGYRYNNDLFVTVDLGSDDLNECIDVLAHSDADYNIHYSLKTIDAVKREMTLLAMDKCKERALLICQHDGCELGKLSSVQYYFNEDTTEEATEDAGMMMRSAKMAVADAAYGASMSAPTEIRVSESVTAAWEIL